MFNLNLNKMKKLVFIFAVMAFSLGSFSCTPEEMNDDTELATDPDKECPEWDRNCDGIPDDQQ